MPDVGWIIAVGLIVLALRWNRSRVHSRTAEGFVGDFAGATVPLCAFAMCLHCLRTMFYAPVEAKRVGGPMARQHIDLPQGTWTSCCSERWLSDLSTAGPFRNAFNKYRAMSCSFSNARFIPPSIGSSAAAGSKLTGELRKTTAARNITNSRSEAASNLNSKRVPGQN